MKRRSFLRESAIIGDSLVTSAHIMTNAIMRPPSARLNLGLIGAKGMGWNVVLKTGRKVYWDDEKQGVINNKKANDLQKVEYRKGCKSQN